VAGLLQRRYIETLGDRGCHSFRNDCSSIPVDWKLSLAAICKWRSCIGEKASPKLIQPEISKDCTMRKAIKKGDLNRTPISIGRWSTHNRGDIPLCPICDNEVSIRGGETLKRRKHFVHGPKTGCPVVKAGRKPYEIFKTTKRVSAAEAKIVKQYALDHIESIYERAKSICPHLLWTEFLPLIEKATQLRCWAFKDFDTGYIPYLLLCCADNFKGKKNTKRPRTIFFVLEPGARDDEFWHFSPGRKNRIWRVDRAGKTIDDILMVMTEVEPWYRKKAKKALGLAGI
jgi:hypothetical protein